MLWKYIVNYALYQVIFVHCSNLYTTSFGDIHIRCYLKRNTKCCAITCCNCIDYRNCTMHCCPDFILQPGSPNRPKSAFLIASCGARIPVQISKDFAPCCKSISYPYTILAPAYFAFSSRFVSIGL